MARDTKSPTSSSDSSSSSSSSDEENARKREKKKRKKRKREKKKQKKKERKKRKRKENSKKRKKRPKSNATTVDEDEDDDEEWKGVVFKNSRKKKMTREELIMVQVAKAQEYIERCKSVGSSSGGSGALKGFGGRDCYGSANSFRDNMARKKEQKLKQALKKMLASQKKFAAREQAENKRMAELLESCGYADKARDAAAKGERPKVRKRET